MKTLYAATAAAFMLFGQANAQTTAPVSPTPSPSATPATPSSPSMTTAPSATTPATPSTTTQNKDAGAPLPGANSFTQGQAQARIEQLGYTNVTGLAKDADGIWRGSAMKDSKTQKVSVDFRGNIVVGQN